MREKKKPFEKAGGCFSKGGMPIVRQAIGFLMSLEMSSFRDIPAGALPAREKERPRSRGFRQTKHTHMLASPEGWVGSATRVSAGVLPLSGLTHGIFRTSEIGPEQSDRLARGGYCFREVGSVPGGWRHGSFGSIRKRGRRFADCFRFIDEFRS